MMMTTCIGTFECKTEGNESYQFNLNSKFVRETKNRFRRILFGPGYQPTSRTEHINPLNTELNPICQYYK